MKHFIPPTSADKEIAAGASTKPYIMAANGNQEALYFMVAWHEHCHEVDDLIDDHVTDPQKWLRAIANLNALYSTAFYIRYALDLRLTVMTITNAYADSLLWENDTVEWKKHWADVIRHTGLEMIYAVAYITGGYDLMRSISLQLKEYAYICHHDKDGNPL